jgi:hypothetical protein
MATTRMRRRPGPLAALLAAEVVWTTGSQMMLLALPWFVLVTTGSPARMGVVVAAGLLALALAGPALETLGPWAGRRRPRRRSGGRPRRRGPRRPLAGGVRW